MKKLRINLVILSLSLVSALFNTQPAFGGNAKKPPQTRNQIITKKDAGARYQDSVTVLIHKLRQTHDKAERRRIVEQIDRICYPYYEARRKGAVEKSQTHGVAKIAKSMPPAKHTTDVRSQDSSSPQTYHIPFASTVNRIELEIANSSSATAANVDIMAQNVPARLHIVPVKQTISGLKPQGQRTVAFSFSVDKAAPVNKEQDLTFIVSGENGEQWTKKIKVSIDAPDHFELYQNFPNPFNPVTKLSYLLPKDIRVVLKIYDILGREVETLVDGPQEAGYKEVDFNASGLPSGVYFYRLNAGNFASAKKMMVMK